VRCRKFAIAAKIAIILGALLTVAALLGFLTITPMAMLGGVAALLGGIVVYGSNGSTLDELSKLLHAREPQRAVRSVADECLVNVGYRTLIFGFFISRMPNFEQRGLLCVGTYAGWASSGVGLGSLPVVEVFIRKWRLKHRAVAESLQEEHLSREAAASSSPEAWPNLHSYADTSRAQALRGQRRPPARRGSPPRPRQ
jgi:hypothetical protein